MKSQVAAKVDTKVNSRRKFLTKTGTGALIVGLPSKSVWGACSVSGAMSGNLSQNTSRHDCEKPVLPNGRSPGYWGSSINNENGNSFADAFRNVPDRNDNPNKYNCLLNVVNDFIDKTNITIPNDLVYALAGININVGNGNLRGLFDATGARNGLLGNFAAVYLNAFFGFYNDGSENNPTAASNLVVDILLYILSVEVGTGADASFHFNFNGSPDTYYTFPKNLCY